MPVYAIGDLQGCHEDFLRLLDLLRFDPHRDRLWLTGDLVNRGPDSLGCLRTVRALGNAATCVLGNHDLHLLAVAAGTQKLRRKDTLQAVLDAPDAAELLDWLRQRPLAHHEPGLGLLVHAGLPPQWEVTRALQLAREVEQVLHGSGHDLLFRHMYGNRPDHWEERLDGWPRLRFIINALTRIRYCTADGRLDLDHKLAPGTQPPGLMPWFEVPSAAWRGTRVVFGHWSTLGLRRSDDIVALDTGCVWGSRLTAVRLDQADLPVTQTDCPGAQAPGKDA
ncbi:MAG: symmetrical bis(5'-nucleosyl)-tetraphosphatase [Gammaproteobacteria bacterium]|nr:MAG: symmetrical bis(5'-nucleosyl)-tetraphosphatase [Gammaproteobacteria bacterium]